MIIQIFGILPDWLTEESLDNMIWKTIHTFWNEALQIEFTEKIALYDFLYEIVLKKSNLLINHANTKVLLVNAIKTVIDVKCRRGKYYFGSLDEINKFDENSGDNARSRFIIADAKGSEEFKICELINRISSIKDKKIQALIIIAGYLICNINEFEPYYMNLINNCEDSEVKESILLLEQRVINNDKLDFIKLSDNEEAKKKIKNVKRQRITLLDICKSIKLNIFKNDFGNTKIQQLYNYLNKNNIFDILTSY